MILIANRFLFDSAEKPDLVVLSGDTVNANFESDFTNKFRDAVEALKREKIPWVSTGGQDRPDNVIDREYMVQREREIGNIQEGENLSITGVYQDADPNQIGHYTQKIPVYHSQSHLKDHIAFNIWIVDSQGGYDCYGNSQGKSCVTNEAVSWFKNEALKNETDGQTDLMFMTYPTEEFLAMAHDYEIQGNYGQ